MTPLFNRIDTVILRVRDYKAAASWYQHHLGCDIAFDDPGERLAVMALGTGTSLTLWEWEADDVPPAGGTAGAFPILAAADASSQRAELESRGVRTSSLAESPGVRFFSFWDLDGNRLEACEVLSSAV
jgi:catechol 2,3-dioxygenase-like lactoylglutathione lyase family enzyme